MKKPRVCAVCEHPRSEHIARVGCVHEYGLQSLQVGKSVCDCLHYFAKPKGA